MTIETRVLESWSPTPTTHALRIARPEDFSFKAGQHVMLELVTPDGVDDRFLSIASGPGRDYLEFAVRLSDSAFKQAFQRLLPNESIRVSRASGRFTLDEDAPAVFLSGGIGITPIKSMIEHATDARLTIPLVLIYGNRSPDEIVFADGLDRLATMSPRLRAAYTVDSQDGTKDWRGRIGHIDAAMVEAETNGLADPIYYTCGPPRMVSAITRLLEDLGLPQERIRTESFSGY